MDRIFKRQDNIVDDSRIYFSSFGISNFGIHTGNEEIKYALGYLFRKKISSIWIYEEIISKYTSETFPKKYKTISSIKLKTLGNPTFQINNFFFVDVIRSCGTS